MKPKHVIVPFTLAGVILPLIFTGLTSYINKPEHYDSALEARVERVMLALWPSCLIEMATDGLRPGDAGLYLIPLTSILLNVLLYAFVGFFVWLGITRHKTFFIVPLIVVVPIWWHLLLLA